MSNSPQPTLYRTLTTTTKKFLFAQSYDPTLPSHMDANLLTTLCTPDHIHTFGPSHFISKTPHLQGSFSTAQLITHLLSMLPYFESWSLDVQQMVVDVVQRIVVVRVRYVMKVEGYDGDEGRVVNEVVWELEMDECGENVWRSREMVDGDAAGRIAELMRSRKG